MNRLHSGRNGARPMTNRLYYRDRLAVDPERGAFDVVFEAQTVLQNATASATYCDAQGNRRELSLAGGNVACSASGDRITLSRTDGTIELVWNARLGRDTDIWVEVVHRGHAPIRLDELRVLSLDAARGSRLYPGSEPADWRFYQNGWQSWSATFVRAAGNGVYADPATEGYPVKHQPHPIPASPKTFSSEWFTVLTSPARPAILIGQSTAADQLGEVRLQLNGTAFHRLDVTCFADGIPVEAGARVSSERLVLAFGGNPLALLERYIARLGETMRARVPARPLTGWCTWYYFFGENTERDVMANVERICAERLPLDVIVVDDGYQAADGDWTRLNEQRFPRGLAWLAAEIKRAGKTPALWVAPFAASESSRLVQEHPEYLLRDESGEPVFSWRHWNEKCFSLDLSREDVLDWLRQTFRVLSDTWGFDLFKLDFLYTASAPGVRHDPNVTRAQALRRGLEAIRETVGDKILLGCGAPLGPSIGIVDLMRIGPDVSVNWEPFFQGDLTSPATAYAMRNTLTRAFLHNRLWQNDPDCVLVRPRKGRRTRQGEGDDSSLVLNEMRTMVSLIGLSGGAVLNSDHLPSLRRGRLKYLKQILPPTNCAAQPLDLFEHELPQVFALPVKTDWGEWCVVGLLNWTDKTTRTEIDLERLGLDPQYDYHVYNYWHRRYLGTVRGRIKITRHQPHETRLLLLKPVSASVELLTTTFHIGQGLCEVKQVRRQARSVEHAAETGKKRPRKQADKRETETEVLVVELEKQASLRGLVLFAVPKTQRVIATRVDGRQSLHRRVGEGIVAVGLTLDERATVEIEVCGV